MIMTQVPKVAFMIRVKICPLVFAFALFGDQMGRADSSKTQVAVVTRPETSSTNTFYIGNRQPLVPSPFLKLPIGSIAPRAWLRHQLQLEADGMTGHLEE